MENERKGLGEVLLIAFMGALIGALAVITFNSFKDQKHLLNSRYKNWNKYDLIMQQVRENYVDSVDMEKITAAAVSAGLATLDPHSIYLPTSKRARPVSPAISTASESSSMYLMTRP